MEESEDQAGDQRQSLDDSAPLLSHGSDKREQSGEGSAGLRSSISNLLNTILGTGMLAMSHAVAAGGIIPGALTILTSGAMAGLGLHLLSLCAQHTPHRQSSFFELSRLTYPKAAVIFDAAIAIKCFGVAISYLIILGSLIPKVATSFASRRSDVPSVLLDRSFWIIICVISLSPLCTLRKLHSLRFISYFSLVAVTDLLLVVIFEGLFRPNLEDRGEVDVVRVSSALVSSLPVYVFAYTCAQNIFSVYNELRDNSSRRMNTVVTTSIGSASILYLIMGLIGYLTFGNKVSANILEMYPHNLLTNQCRFMIVFFVLFSYPLQIHPCRASLDKVFVALRSAHMVDGDRPGSPVLQVSAPTDIPPYRFAVMTAFLLVFSTMIALLVSSLEAVLGIVGATGSTTISFLLPGVFYLKLFPARDYSSRGDRLRRVGARLLLVMGFLIMVVALGLNIAEALHPRKTPGRGGGKSKTPPDDTL